MSDALRRPRQVVQIDANRRRPRSRKRGQTGRPHSEHSLPGRHPLRHPQPPRRPRWPRSVSRFPRSTRAKPAHRLRALPPGSGDHSGRRPDPPVRASPVGAGCGPRPGRGPLESSSSPPRVLGGSSSGPGTARAGWPRRDWLSNGMTAVPQRSRTIQIAGQQRTAARRLGMVPSRRGRHPDPAANAAADGDPGARAIFLSTVDTVGPQPG
jgi:hypothetical protein